MAGYFDPEKPRWQNRARYMRGEEDWYVGNKSECTLYVKDRPEKHWLPWKAVPRPDELGMIEKLWLKPTPRQIEKDGLPPYLSELTNTWFLAMPVTLVPTLTHDTLPPGLVTLWLDFAGRFTNEGDAIPRWPEESTLPQLRGLLLHEPSNVRFEFRRDAEWYKLGLRGSNLPSLEFLRAVIDVEERVLEDIVEFDELLHLSTTNATDRVFEVAPTTLEHLAIDGRPCPKFSGASVTRLAGLRSLNLNLDVEGEVDCRHFSELPKLEEFRLAGVDRLVHVEALLECPRLQWLELDGCGEPFTEQLKARFEARGFRNLDIEHA